MARLTMPRMRPLTRREKLTMLLTVVSIVAYFGVLKAMDLRAAEIFRQTRSTDPALYLRQLRLSHGFEAWLPEYSTLEGYDKYRPEPPEFMIGRWTMRDEPIRRSPGEQVDQCTDPITFDFGLILMVQPESQTVAVDYRIAEGKASLRELSGYEFTVTPVSFGALVDRLEFVPPGREDKVYAYFCGG